MEVPLLGSSAVGKNSKSDREHTEPQELIVFALCSQVDSMHLSRCQKQKFCKVSAAKAQRLATRNGIGCYVDVCPALGDAGLYPRCLSGLNAYGEMRNLRSEATLITKHKVSLGWNHIWFATSLVAESMANKQTNKLVMAVRIADRGHPASIVRMTCL